MMSSPSGSPVSTPSPSPRRPSTPLVPPSSIARPSTPGTPVAFPLLPELGLKIPVRSPTPRSTKVSLWIDRLPRRAPSDVEREVQRVFDGASVGQSSSGGRTLGSRSRSLGTMEGLFAADGRRAAGEDGAGDGSSRAVKQRRTKDSGGLAWWNLAMTPSTPLSSGDDSQKAPVAPSLPRAHSASAFTPPVSLPRPSVDSDVSAFYKCPSASSSASTLTPSSMSHSSPSTPSLVYSSGVSSSNSSSASFAGANGNDAAGDGSSSSSGGDDGRTSLSSTPTPPFSPSTSSPIRTSPIARTARLPLPTNQSSTLKRRSTTGDLLGRYLVVHEDAPEPPAPAPAPKVDPKVARGALPIACKRALPWMLGMWRREK